MLPAIAGMTGTHHHTRHFTIEIGVSQTICPGFPGTEIPLISVSQVIRITGVSLLYQAHFAFLIASFKILFNLTKYNLFLLLWLVLLVSYT
jgi:hypothetical protein